MPQRNNINGTVCEYHGLAFGHIQREGQSSQVKHPIISTNFPCTFYMFHMKENSKLLRIIKTSKISQNWPK